MQAQDRSFIKFIITFALIALFLSNLVVCQIPEKPYTITGGTLKTGDALDIISKKTGFSFTYDSRLVDDDKKVELNFREKPLAEILRSVLGNDSLTFSVIDKYIVISRLRNDQPGNTSSSTTITGSVSDEETGEPLPFATIGFKNIRRGTVANSNGEFVLNITKESFNDTLNISYLGYIMREIPVNQASGSDMHIRMRRQYVSIPEIIIRNQIPQDIILRATRNIPENYGNTPAQMTGFYREGVLRKNDLQTYAEAVLRIHKSAYTNRVQNDQIVVSKSRKIENLDRTDTLAVRLKAGLSSSLELDCVKNDFDFFSPGGISSYNYRLTDIVRYGDESAYVIEFESRENNESAFYRGTMFVNTLDLGVYKFEFEISPSRMDKMKESFITSSSRGFNTWPVSVRYGVTYRKTGNRYFLSHVRGDLTFVSNQRKKIFNTQFKVFFELAITGTELDNVKRFEREELAPVHSVFSQTITSYDSEFWKDMDFLRPEENLLEALEQMDVKLMEFSE